MRKRKRNKMEIAKDETILATVNKYKSFTLAAKALDCSPRLIRRHIESMKAVKDAQGIYTVPKIPDPPPASAAPDAAAPPAPGPTNSVTLPLNNNITETGTNAPRFRPGQGNR